MSGLRFERPIGAGADVKELEYIIALQQTSKETRASATVSSMEIMALLRSRYSLLISHEQAVEVVRCLGGGDTVVEVEAQDEKEHNEDGVEGDSSTRLQKAKHSMGVVWNKAVDGVRRKQMQQEEDDNDAPAELTQSAPANTALDDIDGKAKQLINDNKTASEKQLGDKPKLRNENNNTLGKTQDQLSPIVDNCDEPIDSSYGGIEAVPLATPASDVENAQIPGEVLSSKDSGGLAEDDEEPHGDEEKPVLVEYLDMVQILSTLLIPTFSRLVYQANILDNKKGVQSSDSEPDDEGESHPQELDGRRKLNIGEGKSSPFSPMDTLERCLEALLRNVPEEKVVVDETVVQLLLSSYGEIERVNDVELVQEMVAVAQSSSGFLDLESLSRAITSDVACWDPTNEDTATSFFYDVFGETFPCKETKLKAESNQDEDEDGSGGGMDKEVTVEKSAGDRNDSVPPDPGVEWDEECNVGKVQSLTGDQHENGEVAKPDDPTTTTSTSKEERHPDFVDSFLGLDMAIDASASLLLHVAMWISYILT